MFETLDVSITAEMLALISEIDEFKGRWQLLGRLSPDRLRALKKVATIESIGSSTRIEGSKLSDIEVERLLAQIDSHSFRSRDEQEVAGYALLCEEIFSNANAIPFTENSIKHFHLWLLKHSEKDERHRGEYKKVSNDIQAFNQDGNSVGVVFETSSPFDTPRQMQELVLWTRQTIENKIQHPLIIVGIFVLAFLAIHPFQDGNGRLSRCLTSLLLLQTGYLYVPYCSLESVIEANKESYYLALRRSQQSLRRNKPDLTPWLHFFLRSLQKQKRILEDKVSAEYLLSVQLPELSMQIVNLIGTHGRLSISQLTALTQANRNTIKKHLQALVRNSHIFSHGQGRAVWYSLT